MKQIFSDTLLSLAEQDSKIVVLLCDVTFPGVDEFKQRFPDRLYNFGLTEQATVGIAAGMASQGLRPIMYTIAPFLLERAFEQIKVDVDENCLPLILVGYDYEKHYGSTHTLLNGRDMIDLFKNVRGYFPDTAKQAEYSLRSAYRRTKPSFILLKKSK